MSEFEILGNLSESEGDEDHIREEAMYKFETKRV